LPAALWITSGWGFFISYWSVCFAASPGRGFGFACGALDH
jgi:hypothetical protein